jgi:hypothetical protein
MVTASRVKHKQEPAPAHLSGSEWSPVLAILFQRDEKEEWFCDSQEEAHV